jgi:hypothetical protein
MEKEVKAALRSSEATLAKARATLEELQARDAFLQRALDEAEEEERKAATQNGRSPDEATDTDTPTTQASPQAETLVQQSADAWPTAEQVKGSGAAWKADAGEEAADAPAGDSDSEGQVPHNQNGHHPLHGFDAPSYSRQHSLNGDQPAHFSLAGLSPHSPRHVNVRNGAGRRFVADESEEPLDSNSDVPDLENTAAGSGLPGKAGEAVESRALSGASGGHAVHDFLPQNDTDSSVPASNGSESGQLKDRRAQHANEISLNGLDGAPSSVAAGNFRLQKLSVGSNGHLLSQGLASTPQEDLAAASGSSKLEAGANKDVSSADATPAAQDVGSEEDEDNSWLKRRKHRLPWQ